MKGNILRAIDSADNGLVFVEKVVTMVLCIVLLTAMVVGVVCRYFLFIPTPWTDELGRCMFLWLAFVGAGFIVRNDGHIYINIIDVVLEYKCVNPQKILRSLRLIAYAITVVASLFGLYWYNIYLQDYFLRPVYSTVMGINMIIIYSSGWYCFLSVALHSLVNLILIDHRVIEVDENKE